MRSGKKGFISVHVGAGYHSVLKEKALCDLCRKVCCLAMEELRSGSTAVDVCALAIKMLEVNEVYYSCLINS